MVKAREILEAQLCDSCQLERATAYCEMDCAFLCDHCDAVFHDNDTQARSHVRICTTAGVLEAYSGPRKQQKRNIQHTSFGERCFPFESFSLEPSTCGEENLSDLYLLDSTLFSKNVRSGRNQANSLEALEKLSPTDSLVPEYSSGVDDVCRLFLRDEESSPQTSSEVSNCHNDALEFRKKSHSRVTLPSSVDSMCSEEQTLISDISDSTRDIESPEPSFILDDRKRREEEEEEEAEACTEAKTERRRIALERFRQKRSNRCYQKKIRYECRKRLADVRPRIRGRFVKKEEFQALCLETGDATVPNVY
ncbi:hypothetical protein Gasu2_66630 [Galdieria sulphuraria]|uniref:Transcription factor n=1 Tax=Galdieria sulphuraria TaxID=130081 RepID=M2XTY0_GALSU|nr:transcription factor [Galdieria sulphuraria]EME26854.1 transcription factor [Galdieria sulphuraria]GJD12588.1 hypothetical protein Gasu2_66630 [Galdieria sulphuraria]|eukprot:XP_005703374.1 transcription factor [Galdieria sulphuraria]